jgi:hypothetical protein
MAPLFASREAVKFAVVVTGLFGLDADIIQDKEGLRKISVFLPVVMNLPIS